MTIVIAWLEEGCEAVESALDVRVDLGVRPRTRAVKVAKAVMWLLAGSEADVRKAEAHAATTPHARVYVYDSREPDPLGRARREISTLV